MKQNGKAKGRFLRSCRSVHGWIGVVVLPWVIVIGATGFYLNHSRAIYDALFRHEFSERGFEDERPAEPITREAARALAATVWPEDGILEIKEKAYHGRPSFVVKKPRGLVILSIPTGHSYVKTPYTRRTFSPQGVLLDTKIYWGRIFKELHTTGWLGRALGTWLADAVSLAMVVFGLTGTLMWWVPRAKKFQRSFRRSSRRPAATGAAARGTG
jgi:uncharacterized iron-regulated membrane protein